MLVFSIVALLWFTFQGNSLETDESLQPQPAQLTCPTWACGCPVWACEVNGPDALGLRTDQLQSNLRRVNAPAQAGLHDDSGRDVLRARLRRIGSNGPDVSGLRIDLQGHSTGDASEDSSTTKIDGMGNNGPQITGLLFEVVVDP